MAEENEDFPVVGEIDWKQMEHLANSGSEEDAPEVTFNRTVLSPVMINKRLVWDVSPHSAVEHISAYLDLPVSSEEGMDMEHTDAHDRTEGVVMLAPHIDMLAGAAARAVFANMVVMGDYEKETPLNGTAFTEQTDALEIVIFNSTLAIISELMDWGLLLTPYLVSPEMMDDMQQAARDAQENDQSE